MNIGLVVSDDLDYGLDLANTLADSGDSLTLYLSQNHLAYYLGLSPSASSADVLLDTLRAKALTPESVSLRLFNFPRMRDARSIVALNHLRKMIREDGVEVAHILMGPGELWIAALAILIRDIPVAATMIIPQPNLGEVLPAWVLWGIGKLLTLGSDVLIVNGAEQVDVVCELYAVPRGRVMHVPLVPRVSAAKWAEENYEEEPRTVLFPGKAQPRKGLEYLIRAGPYVMEKIPDAHFLIAAHGEDLPRCRMLIRDDSHFDIREGFLTSAKLAEYFQKASVVALPYLSASTSGMLTTAYVFGKPVVATKVGALPEYVQEGETGFLVPPADPEGLAEALVCILSDDELRHQMEANARRWVAREQKRVAEQTRNVYQRAHDAFYKGAMQ